MLISFSKLFVFISNNSKEEMDWTRLADSEDMFLKRYVLLKLMLEKILLLNDKFKIPPALTAYENPKLFYSEEEFVNNEERTIFETF